MIKKNQKDDSLKDSIFKILMESGISIDNDQIEVGAVQMENFFDDSGEHPNFRELSIVCSKGFKIDSTIKVLEGEVGNEIQLICAQLNKDDVICEGKYIEREGKTENAEYLFLVADLSDGVRAYAGIIQFILKSVLRRAKNISEFIAITEGTEKFQIFFENLQRRRLLGDYAEFYLREKNLPDAEILIELSAARYEGSDSEARIYFDKNSVSNVCTLDEEGKQSRVIHPDKLRLIRKLMEISKRDKLYLYAEKQGDGEFIIKQLVKKKRGEEEGIYIKFSGFMHWSIIHNGKEEITYYHGKYLLNYSDKNALYHAEIENLKRKLPAECINQMANWFSENALESLIKILKKQKHGTSVILTNCKDDLENLCKQNRGMLLACNKKFCKKSLEKWDEEQILSVTGIDGALFMDLEGNCLVIGVLVDGKATIQGDVGRGARYNSVVNYVRQKEEGLYIGIIVSEDGMINIVSNKSD